MTYIPYTQKSPPPTPIPELLDRDYPDLPNRAYWFADENGVDLERFPMNPIQVDGQYEDISQEIINDEDYYTEIISPLVHSNTVKVEKFTSIYSAEETVDFVNWYFDAARGGESFFTMDGRLARTDGTLSIDDLDDGSSVVSFNLISLQTLEDLALTRQLIMDLPEIDFILPQPSYGSSDISFAEEFLCNLARIENCLYGIIDAVEKYLPKPPTEEEQLEDLLCDTDILEDLEDCYEEMEEGIEDYLPKPPTEEEQLQELLCDTDILDELEDCYEEMEEGIEDYLPQMPTEEEQLQEILCETDALDRLEDCAESLEDSIEDNIPTVE